MEKCCSEFIFTIRTLKCSLKLNLKQSVLEKNKLIFSLQPELLKRKQGKKKKSNFQYNLEASSFCRYHRK